MESSGLLLSWATSTPWLKLCTVEVQVLTLPTSHAMLHLHSFKTWPSCRDSHCATYCLGSSRRLHDPHNSTPFMPAKLKYMGNASKLRCQLGIDSHPLDPQLLPQPLYFFEAESEETLLQIVVFKQGTFQKNSQSRPPPFK